MTEPEVRRPVPPTGTQHVIAAHGYRAVVTEVGAGLRALTFRDRPLVMSYPEGKPPVGGAGQLLLPWPNRVRNGRYDADGETRQLAITEPRTGNAAHGFTRLLPWTVLGAAGGRVRARLRTADGSRSVELWGGPGIEWLQVFTGDTLAAPYRRSGVAVEPMSCPPNAFATGECLLRLAPGERAAHRWGITALPAAGA
ncbi:hypothetical protein OG320_06350 [Microbispora sp. NBC_01189]|uniref:aldose epimerase family protein n=1 Tax=Microbispora sp. NBC_01189 TaxID=2903583 RepID=UPI002E101565|nr:hypothetical protein OG320_06350 [Microbispora sp. NBC_01189]